MRIIAKGEDYNVRLQLPTGLVCNRFTAVAISKEAGKYGVKLRRSQMNVLFKALKDYRKIHPDWVLVEVNGAKGEYVQVKM